MMRLLQLWALLAALLPIQSSATGYHNRRTTAFTAASGGRLSPTGCRSDRRRCGGRREEVRCHATAAERLAKNEPVLRDIAGRLYDAGLGKVHLVQDKSLGPGLHNQHYRFETDEGPVFCKVNHRFGFIKNFQMEMEGLKVIQATDTIRAPRPITCGVVRDGHSFLAMEYVEPLPFGPSIKKVAWDLGEGLARLHLAPVPFMGQHYGFQVDTYLGMNPQANEWMDDFAEFFVQRRLMPQLVQAAKKYSIVKWGSTDVTVSPQSFERLLDKVRTVLEPVRDVKPSLLHGDLWQGNAGATRDRNAFIHDPACWYGHAEFDLALATMFGGFLPEFYEAYHSIIPKAEGFEARQEVYRLYHYLNHLNTFGAGFGSSGSVRDPKGYYERTLQLMRSIAGSGA